MVIAFLRLAIVAAVFRLAAAAPARTYHVLDDNYEYYDDNDDYEDSPPPTRTNGSSCVTVRSEKQIYDCSSQSAADGFGASSGLDPCILQPLGLCHRLAPSFSPCLLFADPEVDGHLSAQSRSSSA